MKDKEDLSQIPEFKVAFDHDVSADNICCIEPTI